MKKIICLLLAFVMTVGILNGCKVAVDPLVGSQNMQSNTSAQTSSTQTTPATTQSVPPQTTIIPPTTVPTMPTVNITELECMTRYNVYIEKTPRDVQWPLVIKSVEELQKLPEYGTDRYMDDDCKNILDVYDDAFFAENTLVVSCLYVEPKESCYAFHIAVDFRKIDEGSYAFTLTNYGNWSGSYEFPRRFLIFIEVKADIPADAIFSITPPVDGEVI